MTQRQLAELCTWLRTVAHQLVSVEPANLDGSDVFLLKAQPVRDISKTLDKASIDLLGLIPDKEIEVSDDSLSTD